MKTNSKIIGGNYEREIARKISDWLTGSHNNDLVCWRSPHSGSVGTNLKKKGIISKTTTGDFQCLNLEYQDFFDTFNLDSKSLGNVHLCIHEKNLKSGQLFQEWLKVLNDSISSNKIPIMLTRARNDRKIPDLIIVQQDFKVIIQNSISYNILYNQKYCFKLLFQDEFFALNNWKNLVELNKI